MPFVTSSLVVQALHFSVAEYPNPKQVMFCLEKLVSCGGNAAVGHDVVHGLKHPRNEEGM